MRVRDLLKYALAAGIFALGTQLAPAADETVQIKALRGGTPVTQDNPPVASHQERDHPVADRDFVQKPPLIPHNTAGYQITKNNNNCMDCHDWPGHIKAKAPKVSETHYVDRAGARLDKIAGTRYFCQQCHVPQADARPLVNNVFQNATQVK